MKIIIFAGGAGTRLWPLSRRNSPKQFEKIKDNKSTLQMAVERVMGFGLENIYISTNVKYVPLVEEQIKELEPAQIFAEPARCDLAAAVCLTLLRLKKAGIKGPVAVLWADHFMDRPEEFRAALRKGEKLVEENSKKIVFLGENPRFANHNLGWINLGKKIAGNLYEFLGWKYRPELKQCEKMFGSGKWVWNPGYFVFDIDFVLGLYEKFQSELLRLLINMVEDEKLLAREYQNLPAISFDNAILEKVDPAQAVVIKVDMGWSDPGTLYALKEALVELEEEHYIKGKAIMYDSRDCFVYNEEEKLVAGVGLDGMIIVNTKDALLVCHKDDVPDVKELLKKIEEEGKEEYL